jgi:hypothetical protein
MRFVLLVVGATATGALSAAGIQTMFPQTKETFAAVTALGGNVADFKLGDLNPLTHVYNYVAQQITSGEPARRLALPTAPPITVKPIDWGAIKPGFTIDSKEIQRAWATDINRRVQQDIARARDFQAYGRNPMGWHGIPPH